jgi:hypothetical protein
MIVSKEFRYYLEACFTSKASDLRGELSMGKGFRHSMRRACNHFWAQRWYWSGKRLGPMPKMEQEKRKRKPCNCKDFTTCDIFGCPDLK